MENSDVIIVDFPGALKQADMEGTVYVKLEGAIADLLVNFEPTRYQHFLTKEESPILYALL